MLGAAVSRRSARRRAGISPTPAPGGPTPLPTAVGSSVTLINGANICNVFWQVGSSATVNANSIFNGTIMASASISLGTGATVNGRTWRSTVP